MHVGAQVFADVVLVPHELFQIERRGIVELLAGFLEQERLGLQPRLLAPGLLLEHGGLGWLEHAVESSQHGEGEDDFAVFGLLVVASQQVGDGPDKRGEIGIRHGMVESCDVSVQSLAWKQDVIFASTAYRATPSYRSMCDLPSLGTGISLSFGCIRLCACWNLESGWNIKGYSDPIAESRTTNINGERRTMIQTEFSIVARQLRELSAIFLSPYVTLFLLDLGNSRWTLCL